MASAESPPTRTRRGRALCPQPAVRGFTLIEMLVVLVIVAAATGLLAVAWRGGAKRQLEREGERLAVVLEAARLHARASGQAVRWRVTPGGFVFEGRVGHLLDRLPTGWEFADTVVLAGHEAVLGPEPILPSQRIVLGSKSDPQLRVQVGTDGLAPFALEGVGQQP